MKRVIVNVVALLISFILYYFMLPAFNIHNFGMYGFFLLIITIFSIANMFCGEIKTTKYRKNVKITIGKDNKIGFGGYLYLGFLACFVLIFLINFIYSPVFMSDKYASRIVIDEDTNFNEDIKEYFA